MTKEELEKAHPELAAELRAEGVTSERKRVALHVTFGKKAGRDSGGMARALKAIEAGEPLNEQLMGEYMDAQFRQRAIDLRQEDSDLAGSCVDGAASRSPQDQGSASALADEVERQRAHGPGRSIL